MALLSLSKIFPTKRFPALMQLIKFLYTGSYITMHLRYALSGEWMNVVCMPGDIYSAFTCGSAEHEDRCWLELILEIRFRFLC